MRVCFFGDSFTNGTGDDECLGWVGRVCAAARKRGRDLTAYNLGVRRDTSADILRRWQEEARVRLPAGCQPHLVFAFGNNDAATGDDAKPRLQKQETLSNADLILRAALNWCPTLMIGPVPIDDGAEAADRLRTLSGDLASLCARIQTPYLNLFELPESFWFEWRTEAGQGDGVHPNSLGYEALAAQVQRWTSWKAWMD